MCQKYSATFAGFINNNDDNDDDGGGGGGGDFDDFDDFDNSNASSNPFPPPRRTVAAAGAGARAGAASTAASGSSSSVGNRPPSKSGVSPVQNPYAAPRCEAAAVHALAAEARRAKEMSSKAAAAAAMSPVGGSGTKRGRILQERCVLYVSEGSGCGSGEGRKRESVGEGRQVPTFSFLRGRVCPTKDEASYVVPCILPIVFGAGGRGGRVASLMPVARGGRIGWWMCRRVCCYVQQMPPLFLDSFAEQACSGDIHHP